MPSKRLIKQRVKRTPRHATSLARRLLAQLQAASPKSSPALVSEIAIDLGDLVSVAQNHTSDVRRLLKMTFPKDQGEFQELLARLEVNLLFECEWHLKSLKRSLPKLVHDVYPTHSKRRPQLN